MTERQLVAIESNRLRTQGSVSKKDTGALARRNIRVWGENWKGKK